MNTLLKLIAALTLFVWTNVLWANDTSIAELQSANCADCHGTDGINQDLEGPNLAGQNQLYLIKQINDFSKGVRNHPQLSSGEFNLDNEEIMGLASYYARLKPENSLNRISEDDDALYTTCADCHGDQGEGIAPFPRLSGQKPAYLQQQLINFKSGERKSAIMKTISFNLSDEEIKQLAIYLGSRSTIDEMMASKRVVNDSK